MLSVSPGTNGPTVTWQSVGGVSYLLERSQELTNGLSFEVVTWFQAETNTSSYTDISATGNGPFFYRVRLP